MNSEYTQQGEALITRATMHLRLKYSEWRVHDLTGACLVWKDFGARDACHTLYKLWPSIRREA